MHEREFKDAYRWLLDALEPLCDEVISEVFDHGNAFAIGARWGEGEKRIRTAMRVEYEYREGGEWIETPGDEEGTTGYWEGGEWKRASVNEKIEAGICTRQKVIDSFIGKRPEGWKK